MPNQMDDHVEIVTELIERGDPEAIETQLQQWPSEEFGYVAAHLSEPQVVRLVELLTGQHSAHAASLFERLPDVQGASILLKLELRTAVAILSELPSNDRADLLGEMSAEDAERLINELPPADAAGMTELIAYDDDTAGGLMITEYIAHRTTRKVRDVVNDLRHNTERYAHYDVQYVYATDSAGRLKGVVRLRDLLLTPDETSIGSIMIPAPACVNVNDEQAHLESFFDEHHFFAAPVVSDQRVLVGVVRRSAVEEHHAEQADRTLLAFGGIIGGEELRSMSTRSRVVRRLAFLCPNILLNLVAASVVALYEPTIAAVTALAIFLPMLSDMSGCAGNQAVAVSIRELSLGVLKPRDIWHTLSKELGIGVLNGLVLGSLIGGIAWLMRGSTWPLIGAVVGGAMCINSVLAVSIGGTVPLLLKRVGIDPALAASPILTTFTDMCGFFLTLNLATTLLL